MFSVAGSDLSFEIPCSGNDNDFDSDPRRENVGLALILRGIRFRLGIPLVGDNFLLCEYFGLKSISLAELKQETNEI
jgi:hypothetical protein